MKNDRRRPSRRLHWLVVLPALAGGPAGAADWKITPRVSASETYSDNIAQLPSGRSEGDFVTQLNPGVSVAADGRRLRLQGDYSMQNIFYLDNGDADKTFHQLAASATAELWEELVFVDASASVRQQLTSSSARNIAADNLNISGNVSTVSTLTVSPILRHRFGTTAVSELRYSRSEVRTDQELPPALDGLQPLTREISGSTDRVSLSVSNGPDFQILRWRASLDESRNDNDSGTEQTLRRALLDAGYRINSRFSLVGSVGYDDDDYVSTLKRTSGVRWTAGLAWTPTVRFSLDARFQHSYSGDTFTYNLTQRTRHSTWQSSYTEVVTTTQSQLIEPQTFVLIDPATQLPLLDEAGRPITEIVGVPLLAEDTFLERRFQHSVVWRGAKALFNINLFLTKRESQLSGVQQDEYGATASLSWRLSARTSALAAASWQRFDAPFAVPGIPQLALPGDAQERDVLTARVGLTHQLSEEFSGSVQLSHTDQSGDGGNLTDFSENRIFAGVTKTF